MRHVWTVYCNERLVDADTNNVSLIQVLEQLNFEVSESDLREPKRVVLDSMLVTLWARRENAPNSGEMRITFLDPDGTDFGEPVSHPVDLGEQLRARVFTTVKGIVVKDSGIYHWVIESRDDDGDEWVEVSRVPVEIRVEVGVVEAETVHLPRPLPTPQ